MSQLFASGSHENMGLCYLPGCLWTWDSLRPELSLDFTSRPVTAWGFFADEICLTFPKFNCFHLDFFFFKWSFQNKIAIFGWPEYLWRALLWPPPGEAAVALALGWDGGLLTRHSRSLCGHPQHSDIKCVLGPFCIPAWNWRSSGLDLESSLTATGI